MLFWRLEAAAELERFGRKWCIACKDFCAVVKRSVKLSTAGPKRPVVETGESRKAALSAPLISNKFSHKWLSNTTKLAMALPIARAVVFVALRARSVALRRSLNAAGSGPDLFIDGRSLA